MKGLAIGSIFLFAALNASAATFTSESAWRAALLSFTNDTFQSYGANTDLTTDVVVGLNLSLSGAVGNPEVQDANSIGGLFHTGSLVLSNRGTNFSALTLTASAGGSIFALGYWNVGQDDRTTLTAFDGSNNILDQITTPAVANNLSFQGFINSAGAAKATVQEFSGNGYYTLDDLQVGAISSVPEPGAVWLLGSALAGLAGYRWRNRR